MKNILLKLVTFIGKLYGKLNVAFNETYSDRKVGEIANQEIDTRKEQNKQEFIYALAWKTVIDSYIKTKTYLDPDVALKYAEYVFEQEKLKGNIDELNNVIHKRKR